jgi:hypothetical protein
MLLQALSESTFATYCFQALKSTPVLGSLRYHLNFALKAFVQLGKFIIHLSLFVFGPVEVDAKRRGTTEGSMFFVNAQDGEVISGVSEEEIIVTLIYFVSQLCLFGIILIGRAHHYKSCLIILRGYDPESHLQLGEAISDLLPIMIYLTNHRNDLRWCCRGVLR